MAKTTDGINVQKATTKAQELFDQETKVKTNRTDLRDQFANISNIKNDIHETFSSFEWEKKWQRRKSVKLVRRATRTKLFRYRIL